MQWYSLVTSIRVDNTTLHSPRAADNFRWLVQVSARNTKNCGTDAGNKLRKVVSVDACAVITLDFLHILLAFRVIKQVYCNKKYIFCL